MSVDTRREITITNGGYNDTVTMAQYPGITRVDLTPGLSLSGNVELGNTSEIPPAGFGVFYIVVGTAGAALNGFYFRINGVDILESQLQAGLLFYNSGNGADWDVPIIVMSSDNSAPAKNTSGAWLIDETVTLAKLEDLTSAQIIVGNGSNRPTSVAVTGDVTISNAGVTSIGAGVIVDADVNANAAIARSKLGTGTASHVVINDGSGNFSSEAALAKTRGGFGADVSAANGFVKFNSGALDISAIPEVVTLEVSFETNYVGDFKIKMPFAGTVTEIYAFIVKDVGASNGVITPKNNSGTTMGSGAITFTAADPKGTSQTSSPASNNTFIANDVLTFTTSGGTGAGVVQLSITVTRTQ